MLVGRNGHSAGDLGTPLFVDTLISELTWYALKEPSGVVTVDVRHFYESIRDSNQTILGCSWTSQRTPLV